MSFMCLFKKKVGFVNLLQKEYIEVGKSKFNWLRKSSNEISIPIYILFKVSKILFAMFDKCFLLWNDKISFNILIQGIGGKG
jgi:hypothetical protein